MPQQGRHKAITHGLGKRAKTFVLDCMAVLHSSSTNADLTYPLVQQGFNLTLTT
jgi:hypothetical protein